MKANKDGWIRHRGGKCPAGNSVHVEVRDRNGLKLVGYASRFNWRHKGFGDEVMAWRPHASTTEQSSEVAIVSDALCDAIESAAPLAENQAAQELLNRKSGFVDAAQPTDDLRAIRDRIHAIDAEQKAEVERHCQAMNDYDAERAELVQKLAGEGLALLDKCHELMDGVEERHGAPVEDMGNPENWKVGDLLECIDEKGHGCSVYKRFNKYPINEKRESVVRLTDEDGDPQYINTDCYKKFKWHSRPTA